VYADRQSDRLSSRRELLRASRWTVGDRTSFGDRGRLQSCVAWIRGAHPSVMLAR
jgi:hypothetical protein